MLASRTLSAAGTSNAVQMDHRIAVFSASVEVVFAGGGAASGVTVQYCLEDLTTATDATGAGLTWYAHPSLQNLSATPSGAVGLTMPVTGLRLVAGSISGGETVTMNVVQAGL